MKLQTDKTQQDRDLHFTGNTAGSLYLFAQRGKRNTRVFLPPATEYISFFGKKLQACVAEQQLHIDQNISSFLW